nr:MAG TPA: hypothetical protein [Caudoviricetes sp.]
MIFLPTLSVLSDLIRMKIAIARFLRGHDLEQD